MTEPICYPLSRPASGSSGVSIQTLCSKVGKSIHYLPRLELCPSGAPHTPYSPATEGVMELL